MFLHLSICSVSITVVSTISLIFFNILCIAHCLQCALYHLFSVTLTVALYYLCFFQYSLYHLYFLVFPVTLTVVGILCIIYIRQYALYITLICLYALYHSVCTLLLVTVCCLCTYDYFARFRASQPCVLILILLPHFLRSLLCP